MQPELAESVLSGASQALSQSDLCTICRFTSVEVDELVEFGLLAPLGGGPQGPLFSAACIRPLREASALRVQFDLDLFSTGLLFQQFERIAELERQVRALEVHLQQAGTGTGEA